MPIELSTDQLLRILLHDYSFDSVSLVRYPWLVEKLGLEHTSEYHIDNTNPVHPILYTLEGWLRECIREAHIKEIQADIEKTKINLGYLFNILQNKGRLVEALQILSLKGMTIKELMGYDTSELEAISNDPVRLEALLGDCFKYTRPERLDIAKPLKETDSTETPEVKEAIKRVAKAGKKKSLEETFKELQAAIQNAGVNIPPTK